MMNRWTLSTVVIVSLIAVSLRAESMQELSARQRLREGATARAGMKMRAAAAAPRLRTRAFSTTNFDGFVHCPAELGDQCTDPFGSIFMTNNTAFYRDVSVGAYTSISDATDGETWTAVFTDPNGAADNFGGFTFHSSYNGQTDCFVSPFQVLCGGTSIDILWYLKSQCAPTGTWTAHFANTTIPDQTFELKPQIDADQYLGLQLQGTYPNALSGNPAAPYTSGPNPYDETCRRNILADPTVLHCLLSSPVPDGFVRWSIGAKGCYMTDVAMILTYHGMPTNALTLNNALVGIAGGFDPDGNVNPEVAASYATQQGVKVSYPIRSAGSLSTDICTFGPQLVRVPTNIRPQHWVTAYGVKKDGTVLVRDPSGKFQTLPGVIAVRRFSGPKFNFDDQITGLRFSFFSPVEIFVTDPTGKRVGFDPITQTTYDEILNAYYDDDAGEIDAENDIPDPNPRKTLELFGDVDGDYVLTVTGTATGTYDAAIWALDSAGNRPRTNLDQIPTALNVVQTYVVHFEHADASQAALFGAFDGGGQRPRDVNKFLSYGNPSAGATTLPAGTSTFPLVIFYSKEVLPATFSANLNGANVSSLFHPAAGTMEVVTLALPPGKSVLKLSADGQLPTRVATDSDRLVLTVP